MTKKREITAHKGGRDEVLRGRFTAREKARIEDLKRKHRMSFSDLVMLLVDIEEREAK